MIPSGAPTKAFIGLGVALLVSCSSGDGDGILFEPPPTPVISSLSASNLSPGDILTIEGENFATPATNNRVVFNNDLGIATPFLSTGESLQVIVPQNANTGGMYVTSRGVASDASSVVIERNVGDVWLMARGSTYDVTVPSPAGSEAYMVIPHSATSSGSNFGYSVSPDTTSAYPAPPAVSPARSAGTTTFATRFEAEIRREAIDYIRTHGGSGERPATKTTSAAPAARATFLVLGCTGCSTTNPANYKSITADLKYQGSAALIYADVNQPATGAFTQQDYDDFGMQFDTSIFPTDTMHFGPPTDINGDGRVAILFSPAVNELTPPGTAATNGFISGFFLPIDLGPNLFPSGTSNGMEIFYSMVPDPNNEFGNTFDKNAVTGIIPGTLAHEFEHMISFGFRFVTIGNSTNFGFAQALWLEEGMAHMAEDLNNIDGQNILRANRYLSAPGQTSLVGNAELQPFIDTLEQRGAVYLFLRYLGDQYGEGIYKSILQSGCVGRACIEAATGRNFFALVADFLATLYLSDRNITSNQKYNYSSFNFQQAFGSLLVSSQTVAGGTFGSSVRSVAGDYFEVDTSRGPAINFRVTGSGGSQIRLIVVRTR